jgi:hypothetical protein
MSGLFGAIGQGLSSAGYAAGEMYAKGALLDAQNELDVQKAMRLEDLKQRAKVERQNAILGGGGLMDASGPSSSASAASSPSAGGNDALNISALSKKYNVPEEALRYDLAMNEGKGVAELIAKGAEPKVDIVNGVAIDKRKVQPGVVSGLYTSADGKTVYIEPDKSGKPVVTVPGGALEAQAAQQGVAAGIKAATTPIKVYNDKTKREEFATEADVIAPNGKTGAPASKSVDADRAAIFADERAKIADMIANPKNYMSPQMLKDDPDGSKFVARAQTDLASIDKEAKATGVKLGQAQSGGRLAAGPSTTEGLAKDAQGKINESWVKNAEAVRDAGKAADDLLTNVGLARDSLAKMGGTGWGTEAKAQAAAVLAGLGLANEKVKVYAGSSQTFQSAAMSRLWVTLNSAKGPQTEGDADRAKATFAQLKNTTEANGLILDLAQAQAQRDKARAAFYEQAAPLAQEKGDLTEVDRAWRQRAPSIFDMPSMKRWNIK